MDRARSYSATGHRLPSNGTSGTGPPPPAYQPQGIPRRASGSPHISSSGQSRLGNVQSSLPLMPESSVPQENGTPSYNPQRTSAINRTRHSVGIDPSTSSTKGRSDGVSLPMMLQRQASGNQQIQAQKQPRQALVTYDPTNPFAVKPGEPRERVKSTLFKIQIHRGDLTAVKVVGEGQYGQVYLAKQTIRSANGPTREVTRAVKTLRNGVTPEGKAEFVHEAEMMLDLIHPNVVRLIGVALQQRPWLSVLEYCIHGDLQEILRTCFLRKKKRGRWRFVEQLHIAQQVALGMEYIGQHMRLHIDLAARNVLVTTHNIAKVTDFGLGQQLPPDGSGVFTLRKAMQLPIPWLSQESLLHKQFSIKSDVWSYGVFVWEIFSYARNPYVDEGIAVREIKNVVAEGNRLNCPKDCDQGFFNDVVLPCWHPNPQQRPDFGMLYSLLNARFDQERMRALNRGEGVCIGYEGSLHLSPVRDVACVALGTTPLVGVDCDAAQVQLQAVRVRVPPARPTPTVPDAMDVERRQRAASFTSAPPRGNTPTQSLPSAPSTRPMTAASQKQLQLRQQQQILLQQQQEQQRLAPPQRQASPARAQQQQHLQQAHARLPTPQTNTPRHPIATPRATNVSTPTAQPIFSPLDAGCKVMVYGFGMGVLRYVGPVVGRDDGSDVIGVELTGETSETGDSDGSVNGRQYFKCAMNRGVFCDALDVFRCDKNFVPLLDLARLDFGGLDFSDLGSRVAVAGYGTGTIQFLGLHQRDGRERVGVVLDQPVGKNDGVVRGHRYFSCSPLHGVLVAVDKVSRITDTAMVAREQGRLHNDINDATDDDVFDRFSPDVASPASKLEAGALDSDEVKNNPFFATLDDDTEDQPSRGNATASPHSRMTMPTYVTTRMGPPVQEERRNQHEEEPVSAGAVADDVFASLSEMFSTHPPDFLLSITKSASSLDHAVDLVIAEEKSGNASSAPTASVTRKGGNVEPPVAQLDLSAADHPDHLDTPHGYERQAQTPESLSGFPATPTNRMAAVQHPDVSMSPSVVGENAGATAQHPRENTHRPPPLGPYESGGSDRRSMPPFEVRDASKAPSHTLPATSLGHNVSGVLTPSTAYRSDTVQVAADSAAVGERRASPASHEAVAGGAEFAPRQSPPRPARRTTQRSAPVPVPPVREVPNSAPGAPTGQHAHSTEGVNASDANAVADRRARISEPPEYVAPRDILHSRKITGENDTNAKVPCAAPVPVAESDDEELQGFDKIDADEMHNTAAVSNGAPSHIRQELPPNVLPDDGEMDSSANTGDKPKKKPRWVRVLHKVKKGPNRWRKGKTNSSQRFADLQHYPTEQSTSQNSAEPPENHSTCDAQPHGADMANPTRDNTAKGKYVLSLDDSTHLDTSTTDTDGYIVDTRAERGAGIVPHAVSDAPPPNTSTTHPAPAHATSPALPPRRAPAGEMHTKPVSNEEIVPPAVANRIGALTPQRTEAAYSGIATGNPGNVPHGQASNGVYPDPATTTQAMGTGTGCPSAPSDATHNSAPDNGTHATCELVEPHESYLDESDCQDVTNDLEPDAPSESAPGKPTHTIDESLVDSTITSLLDVAVDIGAPPAGTPPRLQSEDLTDSDSEEALHLDTGHRSEMI